MRRIRAIVTLMAMGSILLGSGAWIGAVVLCKGVDGHITIEAAAQGRCVSDADRGSESSRAGAAVYGVRPLDEHCGPCVDIPLAPGAGLELAAHVPTTRNEVDVPVVSAVFEMKAAIVEWVPPVAHPSGGFMASPVLVRVRTVALRI